MWRMSLLLAGLTAVAGAQSPVILAVGAHAGDMELSAGAVLACHAKKGSRVVLLHLTLGEGGHPGMDPRRYGEQKRREAEAAARALGAEVIFGPYEDGRLRDDDAARAYVAAAIVKVRPAVVITHWKNSMHKDHRAAARVVSDAVLEASLQGWRGVKSLYYAENWEDHEGFEPYVYVDASEGVEAWRKAANCYEFPHASWSGFAYVDYYEGLLKVRGAESRTKAAEAFDIDPWGKKRVVEGLP
jgi:LmbE family N-acetylglucosaminyl deacetylase